MEISKEKLAAAAAYYLETDPGGLDVTASVLSGVGRVAIEQNAKSTNRTLEQVSEELGRVISREVLPALFFNVQAMESVKVDAKQWPLLAGWVAAYTQHRVGRRRR